jgi:hypothetical protein
MCNRNEGRKVERGGGFLLNESIFVLRGLLTRPKLNTLFKKPGFKFYLHCNANKYSSKGPGTQSLKYILSLPLLTDKLQLLNFFSKIL